MTLSSTRTCTTRMTQWSEQNDMTLLSVHALLVWHNGLNRTDMALLSVHTLHMCMCVCVCVKVWHNGLNRTTYHCYQSMRYSCACVCVWKCDTMVWTERYNTVIRACATPVTQWSEQNGHGTAVNTVISTCAVSMTTCSEQSITMLSAHAQLVCHNVPYRTTWHWCQCIQPLVWQHVLNRV